MKIGELSQRSGASRRSLRYYEEVGLLSPARTLNGYREYDESDVTRVWQIRWLFTAGLGSGTVVAILPLVCGRGDHVSVDAALADEVEPTRRSLVAHVSELTQRLDRLEDLQQLARGSQPARLKESA